MAFGHKDPGLNNTTKKEFRKLVDQGYSAVNISDKLNVVLPCIVSFMKAAKCADEQIGDLTETSDAVYAEQITAQQEKLKEAVAAIDEAKAEGAAKDEEIERLRSLLEENDIDYEDDD